MDKRGKNEGRRERKGEREGERQEQGRNEEESQKDEEQEGRVEEDQWSRLQQGETGTGRQEAQVFPPSGGNVSVPFLELRTCTGESVRDPISPH